MESHDQYGKKPGISFNVKFILPEASLTNQLNHIQNIPWCMKTLVQILYATVILDCDVTFMAKWQNGLKMKSSILGPLGVILLALSLTISLMVCLSFIPSVHAQTSAELAETYKPVLHFTQGEKFYPTRVEYIISKSTLVSHLSSTIVDLSPTPSNLARVGSDRMYLNNTLGTVDAIAADYALEVSSYGYYVYVHVVNSGGYTVIQYWLFYVYNNGQLNDHQGDIEVVEIFLEGSEPKTALYSQHFAGENAAWGDVEKVNNTHPVVYVAQGSHANYFRSYQGKIGLENDIVGSDGKTIMPNELTRIMLGETGNHISEQSWLDFEGRWGFWGTNEEVTLGMAGPLGPVFNQDGIRWAQPSAYLDTTFGVGNLYFMLAWLVANFLLLFIIYIAIRGGWKTYGIVKLGRKGGLLVKKFFKSRGGPSLMLGIAAIVLTFIAMFLPWYTINASSESGPLSQQGGATLMTIDGISGLKVNMFVGAGESASGFRNLFSAQLPLAIIFLAGLVLLTLDIIGVKSGKKLGNKFIFGAVMSLMPFILIFVFIMMLPSFLPWASALIPGQEVPPQQIETMVRAVAGNPVYGTNSQVFPVVGTTTVSWGFGIGAYLFLVAAIIRIVAGFMMRTTPELQAEAALPPPSEQPTPPPP